MKRYKLFLKGLLSVNILLILFVLMMGIKESNQKVQPVDASQINELESTTYVTPVGKTVGIYINTKGVFVIDTGCIKDCYGNVVSPAKNKLQTGDYILSLNGEEMNTKKQLIEAITTCQGKLLCFEVLREGEICNVEIQPVQTDMDTCKIGIWVRDDLQGLGTMTYVKNNQFTALGHSVNDTDVGSLLDISGGDIYEATIFGIDKGEKGEPGIIEGAISYDTDYILGHIEGNYVYGIYGEMTKKAQEEMESLKSMPVATVGEVEKGRAYLQSYVSGECQQYEVEIEGFHKNDNGDMEMEIKVIDPELLDLTGGIIQGMSGSPLVQNGKMIGAVTHVYVDDPTRGYGIFIENMLEH